LLVVLAMRARNSIASWRPIRLLIPLSLLQVVMFSLAILFSKYFITIYAIGNIISAWIVLLPAFHHRPKTAHWVTGNENL
jgi:hypothetical protein